MWASASGAAGVLAEAFLSFVARFTLPIFPLSLRGTFAIGLLLAVWVFDVSLCGSDIQINQPRLIEHEQLTGVIQGGAPRCR